MNRWVQGPIRTAATWGIIIQTNRQCLRKSFRKHRRSLSPIAQGKTNEKITKTIVNRLFFQRASKIAFYLPFDGEVNPLYLCSLAHHLGKKCYVPQVSGRTLKFKQFIPNKTKLQKNEYNIFEPIGTEIISSETLDVVFMPLVAFDRDGNRIGMGQGYYDNTFSEKARWEKKPLLIGLAHSFQETVLQPHAKDIPMDGVTTEKSFIYCQGNANTLT